MVETLAENMKRFPRKDHRFTVVHFAVSTEEQVKALGEMGAIVTANPYYVNALADKYSEFGLGPSRADNMVRLGSVASKGMILALHSDMPMAPADPLFLAWCAAERLNVQENRVAARNQRISIERALSGVTIESAYCLGLENEIGSIKPQKKANFAILEDDPMDVKRFQDKPDNRLDNRPILKDVGVWGCVFEGKKFHLEPEKEAASEIPILPTEINLHQTKDQLLALASTRG